MSFVLNPDTGRQIKVGGRVYNKLVRKGIISLQKSHNNEKVVFELDSDPNSTIKKGRGAYEGQMTKNDARVSFGNILKLVSNLFYNLALDDNFFHEVRQMSRCEFLKLIQERILESSND